MRMHINVEKREWKFAYINYGWLVRPNLFYRAKKYLRSSLFQLKRYKTAKCTIGVIYLSLITSFFFGILFSTL